MQLASMMWLLANPSVNVIANMWAMDVHANWHPNVLLTRIVLRTHSALMVCANVSKAMNAIPTTSTNNIIFLY